MQRNRISNFQAIMLLFVSFLVDLLSLVPVVNWVVLVLYWIIFPLWYILLRVPMLRAKRLANFGLASVLEAIPVLSLLPGYTVSTLLTIRSVRKEDKKFNAENAAALRTQREEEARTQAQIAYMNMREENNSQ